MSIDLPSLLEFTKEMIFAAGKLVIKQRGIALQVVDKGKYDIVTNADFASQKFIVDTIQSKYPEHGFLAEENSYDLPAPKHVTWVIDPIDGTVNFSRQNPIFCISIGVLIDGVPSLGAVYDPLHDELFTAFVGGGCYVNGHQVKSVSNVIHLDEATIGLDWDSQADLRLRSVGVINSLVNEVRAINIFGSAALALAWIAVGRMDAYFKFRLDPWDIVAGAVMLKETGGRISDHHANDWSWQSTGKTFIASNGSLHKQIIQYLET